MLLGMGDTEEDRGPPAQGVVTEDAGVCAEVVTTQNETRFDGLKDPSSVAIIAPQELVTVRTLGEGTYAKVEECLLNGTAVAVKRLKPGMFSNKVEVNGFVTEGAVIARLNHPGIVRILGLGFHVQGDGLPRSAESLFMVQELCSGGSLGAKVMAQMKAWNQILYTYSEALRWCTQLTLAVGYIHDQHPLIIHRDLRLDNILLTDSTDSADVKLVDFGLIALVSGKGIEDVSHDLTGQTGSYLNMAPEIIMGEKYNEKADIFSLGCCMFDIFSKAVTAAAVAVTGEEYEFKQIAQKVAQGFRRDMPPHWPPVLKKLVIDCWAHDPSSRPTAAEVVARLESPAFKTLVEEWDVKEKARLAGCCVVQ